MRPIRRDGPHPRRRDRAVFFVAWKLLPASRAGSCVDEVAGFVVVDVSPAVGSVVSANIAARPPHQIVDLSVLF